MRKGRKPYFILYIITIFIFIINMMYFRCSRTTNSAFITVSF